MGEESKKNGIEMKVLNIEEMRDWDILEYLRYSRNWMVQSHYSREDLESMYDIQFTDDMWEDFVHHSCKSFGFIKECDMDAIMSNWDYEE